MSPLLEPFPVDVIRDVEKYMRQQWPLVLRMAIPEPCDLGDAEANKNHLWTLRQERRDPDRQNFLGTQNLR